MPKRNESGVVNKNSTDRHTQSLDPPLPSTYHLSKLDQSTESYGPGREYIIPTLKPHQAKHCIECQEVFHLFKQKHNCKNCGHVVCSDCSKHRRPLPKFGYDNAVRCCNTCDLHIMMQEMNSSMLGSQSLKQLKQYIRCYNLPSQHALEKDDLVKLIFNTRPLTNQNERHYRKLRDQQYADQVEAQSTHQGQQQNDDSAGDLFDDNPLSNMFNKISDLFITPDPIIPTQQQQSSTSTPPRQRQQQQPPQSNYRPTSQHTRPTPQQQQQRPSSHQRPPPASQTSTQQHTSPSSYPTYIYPERQQSSPRPTTTTTVRPSTAPTAPPPRQSPPPAPPSTMPSPPPGNTVTLKEMLALSIDPATMSVRTLKHILRTNHVEQNFALEKKDLVARVQQLIEDEKKLQKERHHADNNNNSDKDEDDIHEDMVCRICYDSVQNCVFLNCGHMATCIDCGLKLVETKNECPICRDSIVRVVRVFRS